MHLVRLFKHIIKQRCITINAIILAHWFPNAFTSNALLRNCFCFIVQCDRFALRASPPPPPPLLSSLPAIVSNHNRTYTFPSSNGIASLFKTTRPRNPVILLSSNWLPRSPFFSIHLGLPILTNLSAPGTNRGSRCSPNFARPKSKKRRCSFRR